FDIKNPSITITPTNSDVMRNILHPNLSINFPTGIWVTAQLSENKHCKIPICKFDTLNVFLNIPCKIAAPIPQTNISTVVTK
ncbi:unnamed protein product, partial [marine sediment metagenome]